MAVAVNGAVHVVQGRRSLRGTVGLAVRESVNAAVRMTAAVGMPVIEVAPTVIPVGVVPEVTEKVGALVAVNV